MVQEDDYEAWRVRRASVKVISAFISTASSSLLFEKFDNICWILVSRFIDRDVDVKIEVFHSIRNLMSSTVRKTGNGCLEFDQPQLTRMPSLGLPPMVRAVSTAVLLETHISKIIEEILKQIDKGDVSTKSAAYSVIREICIVRNGTLENWFNHIFECLSLSMKERDAAVRSKALDLLALLFEYHPSKFCTPVIPIVSQPIADAITDRTTRLKVQGLHCCEIIARIMRPNFDEYLDSLVSSLQFLYSKALEEMRQIDIEQNARIAALSAVSEILSRFGDVFNDTLPTTLSIFHERLLNQTTRISALKAFTKMCNSPIKIDMSSIKSKAIDTIVSFLKRSTQEVTHEAATALNSLLLNDYGGFDLPIIPDLLEEVSDFICDEDLFLAHLVLDIIATMIKNEIIPKIPRKIIDKCFNLLKSPLIQGSDALQSLQQVFFAFLQCQTESSFNYQTLLNDIISLVNSDLSVESYTSISKCAAYIAIRTDEINQKETIERFISDVDCKEKPKAHIALLCLGEIGRVKDFSKTNSGNVVFDAFKRESREIKSAASFALGCISISNLNYYLMDLLSKIEKYPKFRYLLLSSLKEIISFHTNSEKLNDLRKHSEKIIPILLENSKTNDEGEKAIISECLGKLVIIDYNKTIPKIEQNLQNKNSEVRATMIASVKFALCGDKQVQEVLRNKMDQFLKLLNDNEIQG